MRTCLVALALTSVLAIVLTACQPATPTPVTAESTAPAANAAPAPVVVKPWPLPAPVGAAQPDLVATADGDLLLSWIAVDGKGHALRFARFDDGHWNAPRSIARGDDWFVNWADTPHLAVTGDGALWAHWLQKSAAATYAYDVALVRSADGGKTWSAPVLVNDDGTPTEHGFVAMWPASGGQLGIAWLDGRAALAASDGGGHSGHGGHGGGMMMLRSARFDPQRVRSGETVLDTSTCDCCQTDAALTARGPLLVYRDRTPDEVRDIAVTRFSDGRWSAPAIVHADHWVMPACPVNGPAVDARGNAVLVGWYTAAGGIPTLKLARSGDAGDHFQPPVTVAAGNAVQGRVDVALGKDAAWVLWVREDAGGQSLHLARYTPDLTRELQRIELARLQGRGRATGFAQLVLVDGVAHVAWVDVVDGTPRLLGAVLQRAVAVGPLNTATP